MSRTCWATSIVVPMWPTKPLNGPHEVELHPWATQRDTGPVGLGAVRSIELGSTKQHVSCFIL